MATCPPDPSAPATDVTGYSLTQASLCARIQDFLRPVCTTELWYLATIKPEFERRNVKVIGLSIDPVARHPGWLTDIEETQGQALNYPMIGDADFHVSKLCGILPAATACDPGRRTPADNQTVRNVLVIGPDKKIKLVMAYPVTTGRNFDDVLRVIDSLQLTAEHRVATPVNWVPGEDVIIAGSVSNEEARNLYPAGWHAPKPYLRIVPDPHGRSSGRPDRGRRHAMSSHLRSDYAPADYLPDRP